MKAPNDSSKLRSYASINMDLLAAYNEPVYNHLKDLGLSETGVVSLTREQWNDALKVVPNLFEVLKTASDERNEYVAQREKDEQNAKAVDARIRWWVAQGLVNSDQNAKTLIDFVDSHKKLRSVAVTPDLIDAVVQILRHEGKLQWASPTPAPAPAREPVVRTLPNGEPELPIDALQTGAYHGASKVQLQDLSRRLGEGRSFFDRTGRVASNLDVGRQSQVV